MRQQTKKAASEKNVKKKAASEENVKCSCTDVCQDLSPDVGGPVCGSDHITYKNRCSLAKAACGKQENITLLTDMACSKYCI